MGIGQDACYLDFKNWPHSEEPIPIPLEFGKNVTFLCEYNPSCIGCESLHLSALKEQRHLELESFSNQYWKDVLMVPQHNCIKQM